MRLRSGGAAGKTRRRRKSRSAWNDYFPSIAANEAATNKKPDAKCQCADPFSKKPCAKEVLRGSLFCAEHQGCPGSPQSGYEPPYDPMRYNRDSTVRLSHNCYSYGMNVLDPISAELCKKNGSCRRYFHQPGAKHGDRNALNTAERRSCAVVERLQKADTPAIQKGTFYGKCPKGMSKIALVVDPGEDYHYYRQDADGMWSHKDGSNKVKRYDALKRPIFNPALAARNYLWQNSDLNYEDFCGFYCVPRDGTVKLGRGGAAVARHYRRYRRQLQKQKRVTRRLHQQQRQRQKSRRSR